MYWGRTPVLLGKIWCGWWRWRRGEALRRPETAATNSPPGIPTNKPKVCPLPLVFIVAALVFLLLGGRGGEERRKLSSGRGDSGGGMGLVLPVLRRGTWRRSTKVAVKPLWWGWIVADSPAKTLGNKRLWRHCCVLGVLNIDLAGRGGEEGDEDGVNCGSMCGQSLPSYSLVRWSSAGRSQRSTLHGASSVEASCRWGGICGSEYLLIQFGARTSFEAHCTPLFLLAGRGGEGKEGGASERRAWPGYSGEFRTFPLRWSFPRYSDYLCLPSPTRGRSDMLECGSLVTDGGREDSSVGDFRSMEATLAGIILTAVCRVSKPVSSGVFSTSIGDLRLGKRPRPTSTLKQVVLSPRRCSAAVQLTFGSAVKTGRDLIASHTFQRGLLHIKWGPMCYFLFLLGSSIILYSSTVCILI